MLQAAVAKRPFAGGLLGYLVAIMLKQLALEALRDAWPCR
jgi:hypothetical protein